MDLHPNLYCTVHCGLCRGQVGFDVDCKALHSGIESFEEYMLNPTLVQRADELNCYEFMNRKRIWL